MNSMTRCVVATGWGLMVATAGISLSGCEVDAYGPGAGPDAAVVVPSGYAEVDFVDNSGWHHHGYYDEHHVWHGGYYDADHHYHHDAGDWHR
jgi:hypothetical protein